MLNIGLLLLAMSPILHSVLLIRLDCGLKVLLFRNLPKTVGNFILPYS